MFDAFPTSESPTPPVRSPRSVNRAAAWESDLARSVSYLMGQCRSDDQRAFIGRLYEDAAEQGPDFTRYRSHSTFQAAPRLGIDRNAYARILNALELIERGTYRLEGLRRLFFAVSPPIRPAGGGDATRDGMRQASEVRCAKGATLRDRLRIRVQKMIKMTTHNGFFVEAGHPLLILTMGTDGRPRWKKMRDLEHRDRVAIGRGQEIWGDHDPGGGFSAHIGQLRAQRATHRGGRFKSLPKMTMDDDLAYFLGLWIAEGSIEERIGRVTITCGDPEVGTFLTSGAVKGLEFKSRPGRSDQWCINCGEFVDYMRFIAMPLCKAPQKWLPEWVMNGRHSWAMSFIAGMFDGDGYCSTKATRIGYNSASYRLINELQLLLTNFGVISRQTSVRTPPTKRVAVESLQHRLTISGSNVALFRKNVHLRIKRKQLALEMMPAPSWSRRDGIPMQAELLRAVRNSMRRRHRDLKIDRGVFLAALEMGADISYRTLYMFLASHPDEGLEEWAVLCQNAGDNYYWDQIVRLEASKSPEARHLAPGKHGPKAMLSK